MTIFYFTISIWDLSEEVFESTCELFTLIDKDSNTLDTQARDLFIKKFPFLEDYPEKDFKEWLEIIHEEPDYKVHFKKGSKEI